MIIKNGKVQGAGVVLTELIDDRQCILFCRRSDGQGWCFPGGKVDEGEVAIQTAKRELSEETGFIAKSLEYVGTIESSSKVRGEIREIESQIWTTDEYRYTNDSLMPNFEMAEFEFVPIDYIDTWRETHELFAPTKKSLQLFLDWYNK